MHANNAIPQPANVPYTLHQMQYIQWLVWTFNKPNEQIVVIHLYIFVYYRSFPFYSTPLGRTGLPSFTRGCSPSTTATKPVNFHFSSPGYNPSNLTSLVKNVTRSHNKRHRDDNRPQSVRPFKWWLVHTWIHSEPLLHCCGCASLYQVPFGARRQLLRHIRYVVGVWRWKAVRFSKNASEQESRDCDVTCSFLPPPFLASPLFTTNGIHY